MDVTKVRGRILLPLPAEQALSHSAFVSNL
jgi:hypothetical protein